jgi:mycoredoxin
MSALSTPGGVIRDRLLVYSTRWCSDCRVAKRVLDEHGVDYDEIDIDDHPEAVAEVLRLNHGMRSVPTIIFPDGSVLVEPSRRELTQKL